MINVNEKLMNLKASVFDNSENVKSLFGALAVDIVRQC